MPYSLLPRALTGGGAVAAGATGGGGVTIYAPLTVQGSMLGSKEQLFDEWRNHVIRVNRMTNGQAFSTTS